MRRTLIACVSCLMMAALAVNADDLDFLSDTPEFNNKGWFVGAEMGQVRTEMTSEKINNATYHDRSPYIGIVGGYNFTDWFGLEGSLLIPFSAEDDIYTEYKESSFFTMNFQPVFMAPITDRFSFYLKGGLSFQMYSLDDTEYTTEELDFSGVGVYGGAGFKFAVTPRVYLQLGAHYSEATLVHDSDEDDHSYSHSHDGNYHRHYSSGYFDIDEPDIDVTASWYSMTVYGQF